MIKKKGFYCRYGRENSQRHLEGSRLKKASRVDQTMRQERKRASERGREKRGAKRTKKVNRNQED